MLPVRNEGVLDWYSANTLRLQAGCLRVLSVCLPKFCGVRVMISKIGCDLYLSCEGWLSVNADRRADFDRSVGKQKFHILSAMPRHIVTIDFDSPVLPFHFDTLDRPSDRERLCNCPKKVGRHFARHPT